MRQGAGLIPVAQHSSTAVLAMPWHHVRLAHVHAVETSQLAVLAASIVAIDCCPSTAGRRQQSPGTHILAVACTDGGCDL